MADFQYVDNEGLLTRILFGDDKAGKWAAPWPTYHIEVKSTSDSEQTPFHMSARQLQMVSKKPLLPLSILADRIVRLRVSLYRLKANQLLSLYWCGCGIYAAPPRHTKFARILIVLCIRAA